MEALIPDQVPHRCIFIKTVVARFPDLRMDHKYLAVGRLRIEPPLWLISPATHRVQRAIRVDLIRTTAIVVCHQQRDHALFVISIC